MNHAGRIERLRREMENQGLSGLSSPKEKNAFWKKECASLWSLPSACHTGL